MTFAQKGCCFLHLWRVGHHELIIMPSDCTQVHVYIPIYLSIYLSIFLCISSKSHVRTSLLNGLWENHPTIHPSSRKADVSTQANKLSTESHGREPRMLLLVVVRVTAEELAEYLQVTRPRRAAGVPTQTRDGQGQAQHVASYYSEANPIFDDHSMY